MDGLRALCGKTFVERFQPDIDGSKRLVQLFKIHEGIWVGYSLAKDRTKKIDGISQCSINNDADGDQLINLQVDILSVFFSTDDNGYKFQFGPFRFQLGDHRS